MGGLNLMGHATGPLGTGHVITALRHITQGLPAQILCALFLHTLGN